MNARASRGWRANGFRTCLLLTALIACDRTDLTGRRRRELAPYLGTDSMGVIARHTMSIAIETRHKLLESSAAPASIAQPGIVFTINDSGNEPLLFALDTTGHDRGTWRVLGATNRDWEAASIGPCFTRDSTGRAPPASSSCIYIGDVGDNSASRSSVAIYRVPEPVAQGSGDIGQVAAQTVHYRYFDGPHDVEAMYVGPQGDVYFITKRPLEDPTGRPRPSLVFMLSRHAWLVDTTSVAVLVDSVPIVPGSAPLRFVTDAALSPDARYVAVRTYAQVYVFAADSATGRLRTTVPPSVCNIAALGEPQGEGIGWLGLTRRLVLTSERPGAAMHLIECPLPRG